MKIKKFIGIDIGGTTIKYSIINESGEILFHSKTATDIRKGIDFLESKLVDIVHSLMLKAEHIQGVGISTTGCVHSKTGEIVHAGNTMPDYTGTNLKQLIEKEFHITTSVNNDVNAAALGEAWIGAARDINTFFCLTLGTGIGGAFVIDKKLSVGRNFRAGEIGYLRKDEFGKSFEDKAATSALIRTGREKLQNEHIDGKELFDLAKTGDETCNRIIDQWCNELSKGIADIICILDPGVIIIGGAVSQQGTYLIEKIRESLKQYVPTTFAESTVLKIAQCGNDAGMLGAVYPFLNDGS
ncbi:ROK family protein [Virgibacillus necropolis]|uniref:ROK family protein n=1 Tax=Virgibacillus necropolis TaxID=163877 RepID=UPI0038514A47